MSYVTAHVLDSVTGTPAQGIAVALEAADGSFKSQFGPTVGTSFSLLALALNYRFLPIYER